MKRFLFISLLFLLYSGCNKDSTQLRPSSFSDLQVTLRSIPEKDRDALDSFFQLLSRDYDFAYTLFGKKPVSLACYASKPTLWTLHYPSESLNFEKGWITWMRYASLFPSQVFVLKKCQTDRDVSEIFLINKEQVLRVINENLKLFQETLGIETEPKALLQRLCDPEQEVMHTLQGHSGLLGILLGYGSVNSMLFKRKLNICHAINAKMTPPFHIHHLESLTPISRNLVSLFNEKAFTNPQVSNAPSLQQHALVNALNDMLSHECPFELYGTDSFLDTFIPPSFMMQTENPETEQLAKDYLETKQHLRKIYLQGPFLEVTLKQWMSLPQETKE